MNSTVTNNCFHICVWMNVAYLLICTISLFYHRDRSHITQWVLNRDVFILLLQISKNVTVGPYSVHLTP